MGKYNEIVLKEIPARKNENFWDSNTVHGNEQKHWQRKRQLENTQAPLDEKLVYDSMDRIEALGLPKGKLTIDDGWLDGWADLLASSVVNSKNGSIPAASSEIR